ncbi:hypothetical protein [Ramlibacter sp. 2FC]|uniref:hypothetical protein n=1 Tax=Ramlibacter sp. 2FC TaxID=2502188 RepID=UPI0010FA5E3D|nr:hypothetical protein [Ramlibacter sp. 2FC]
MGIALLTLSCLLSPLRARLARKKRAPGSPATSTALLRPPHASHAGAPAQPAARHAVPLRVVRVAEAGYRPGCAGRMVISGRMADVCAELDRLAARESALAQP